MSHLPIPVLQVFVGNLTSYIKHLARNKGMRERGGGECMEVRKKPSGNEYYMFCFPTLCYTIIMFVLLYHPPSPLTKMHACA